MVNIIDASGNEKPGGGPQTAKAMPTNPANTGLNATNVDDSLKELNSNISQLSIPSITITADGSKTYRTIFDEIYSQINMSKITPHSKLVVDKYYFAFSRITGNVLMFSRFAIYNATTLEFNGINLATSGSDYYGGNATTTTNLSNNTPTSGTLFEFYY